MHTNKLLYFSLDKEARTSFHQYAEKSRAVYEHSFQLVDKNSELCEYGHASDLMVILEHIDQHEDLGHFFVIIDYLSLCSDKDKSNKEFDLMQRVSDIIRRAILKYPDILFLFDESGAVKINASGEVQKEKQKDGNVKYLAAKYDFLDFLFNCSGIPKDVDYPAPNCIRKELHQFNVSKDSDPFFFIRRSRDNLFDGSNLRYFVKQFLYNEFHFDRQNFRFEQRSRAMHLALCVEKEASQNKFNSYALYANGFRVTQVLSAEELKFLNEKCPTDNTNSEKQGVAKSENGRAEAFIEFARPDIIVRDFDLQFNDIDTSKDIHEIDKIRGAKYVDDNSSKGKWEIGEMSGNSYWNNLIKPSTYYVANREDNIIIKPSQSSPCHKDSGEKLVLPGLPKPVSGIYTSFRRFDEVKDRVKDIRDLEKKAKEGEEPETKEGDKKETYSISTKRKGHDHSRALDVYDLAKSMVERAEICFANENYVRSAVIASEAIEVMNGFHTSLMLKAYSIKSKAENAIAIDILGGSEKELCEDACVRIEMIKKDIARLLGFNKEQSINVLSQIFSDCRNYCKEKEHFESEDVFLSAMAELNEGSFRPLLRKIKNFFIS